MGRNPTCDLALIRWLLTSLLDAVKTLAIEEEEQEKVAIWTDVLSHLTDYSVDNNGLQIMENQPYNVSYRLMNHLLPIYPLHTISVEGDRSQQLLINNSLKNLRRIGNWDWTGETYPWLSAIVAWANKPWLAYSWLQNYLLFIRENTMHVTGILKI